MVESIGRLLVRVLRYPDFIDGWVQELIRPNHSQPLYDLFFSLVFLRNEDS